MTANAQPLPPGSVDLSAWPYLRLRGEPRPAGETVGIVYADIEVMNGGDLILVQRGLIAEGSERRLRVRAMVDSGAYTLAINEDIRQQLDLPVLEHKTMRMADGRRVQLPVVGPVEVRFENRRTSVDAVVLPGSQEPLLGAIPMEAMDVLIDPRNTRLVVNPENPDMPAHPLK